MVDNSSDIDEIAAAIAEDSPDVEEHRELIKPLAERVVELLACLACVSAALNDFSQDGAARANAARMHLPENKVR